MEAGPLHHVAEIGTGSHHNENTFHPSSKTETSILKKSIEYIDSIISSFKLISSLVEINKEEDCGGEIMEVSSEKQGLLSWKFKSSEREIVRVKDSSSIVHDDETGELLELPSYTFQSSHGLIGFILIMLLLFLVCLFL